MATTKRALREKYRKIRGIIAPRIIEEDSIRVCRKVFRQVNWSQIKKLCAYEPIAELKEVDVGPLLEAVEYKYPDIKIHRLSQSPKARIPKTRYDLIIVPCLAFDKDNYRLGWGGGFYDKFLAGQPQAVKIGLCFRIAFIKNGIPREPHDVPLDKIITE